MVLDRLISRFRNREKEAPEEIIDSSLLREICGEDEEIYDVLSGLLFLRPHLIPKSLEDTARKAQRYKKEGRNSEARRSYSFATSLAMYEAYKAYLAQGKSNKDFITHDPKAHKLVESICSYLRENVELGGLATFEVLIDEENMRRAIGYVINFYDRILPSEARKVKEEYNTFQS